MIDGSLWIGLGIFVAGLLIGYSAGRADRRRQRP